MANPHSAFCSEVARESGELLGATASRVDHWIVVEYRRLWSHDAVAGSGLSEEVKRHLKEQTAAIPRSKLLFVRRSGSPRDDPALSVFWGFSPEREATLSCARIDRYEDLLELDFARPGEPVPHPLLLVCTHGKHDRCCARYGRPLYEALRDQADDRWVWQSTHVGGDRFAGNLVCLPEGLYFGRVERDDVWPLLDDYLAGRIFLDRYRGRSCYAFAVQAGERAVREQRGLTGISDLTLVQAAREDGGWTIRFLAEATGTEYVVDVSEEAGDLTYLTCKASQLRHPRRFVAGIPRESAA
jgi:hypothetical protein